MNKKLIALLLVLITTAQVFIPAVVTAVKAIDTDTAGNSPQAQNVIMNNLRIDSCRTQPQKATENIDFEGAAEINTVPKTFSEDAFHSLCKSESSVNGLMPSSSEKNTKNWMDDTSMIGVGVINPDESAYSGIWFKKDDWTISDAPSYNEAYTMCFIPAVNNDAYRYSRNEIMWFNLDLYKDFTEDGELITLPESHDGYGVCAYVYAGRYTDSSYPLIGSWESESGSISLNFTAPDDDYVYLIYVFIEKVEELSDEWGAWFTISTSDSLVRDANVGEGMLVGKTLHTTIASDNRSIAVPVKGSFFNERGELHSIFLQGGEKYVLHKTSEDGLRVHLMFLDRELNMIADIPCDADGQIGTLNLFPTESGIYYVAAFGLTMEDLGDVDIEVVKYNDFMDEDIPDVNVIIDVSALGSENVQETIGDTILWEYRYSVTSGGNVTKYLYVGGLPGTYTIIGDASDIVVVAYDGARIILDNTRIYGVLLSNKAASVSIEAKGVSRIVNNDGYCMLNSFGCNAGVCLTGDTLRLEGIFGIVLKEAPVTITAQKLIVDTKPLQGYYPIAMWVYGNNLPSVILGDNAEFDGENRISKLYYSSTEIFPYGYAISPYESLFRASSNYGWEKGVKFFELTTDGDYENAVDVYFNYNEDENPYAGQLLRITDNGTGQQQETYVTDGRHMRKPLMSDSTCTIELLSTYGYKYYSAYDVSANSVVIVQNALQPLTVSLSATDESGNALPESKYSVSWYLSDRYISSRKYVHGLIDGVPISYEIKLSDELAQRYSAPGRKEIIVDKNNLNVIHKLIPLSRTKISGTVKSEDGTALPYALLTVTQKYSYGLYNSSTYLADKDGIFEIESDNVETAVVISYRDYMNYEWTGNPQEFKNRQITLEKIDGQAIVLNLSRTYIAEDGNGITETYISADELSFSVKNVTTGKDITSFVVSYPYMYLSKSAVSNNDRIKIQVSDTSGNFTSAECEIVYKTDSDITAKLNVIEKGAAYVYYSDTKNDSNMAIAFDSEGKYVASTLFDIENKAVFEHLDNGSYTVICMGNSYYLSGIHKLSQFDTFGLVQNTDYAKVSVTVNEGGISIVNNVSVPALNEQKLNYINPDGTSVIINQHSIALGEKVLVRTEFAIADKYAEDVQDISVVAHIPNDCSFVEGSLTVNGIHSTQYDFNEITNTLTAFIHNGRTDGILRFYVVPLSCGKHTVSADAEFTYLSKDEISQPLGSASVNVTDIDMTVPEETTVKNVTVSGKAWINSDIEIFDGDVLVAETKSNMAGDFKAEIELNIPYRNSYHNIYAVLRVNGLEARSEAREVHYNPDVPQVSMVKMKTRYDTCVFDFMNPSSKSPSYTFVPGAGQNFTFAASFVGNNDLLDEVWIVTTNRSGQRTYIPTDYVPSQECWAATRIINDSNDIPYSVNVTFTIKTGTDTPAFSSSDIQAIINPMQMVGAEYEKYEEELREQLIVCGFSQDEIDDIFTVEETLVNDLVPGSDIGVEQVGTGECVCDLPDGSTLTLETTTTEGLTPGGLLNSGFKPYVSEEGEVLYVKGTEGRAEIVDFVKDVHQTVEHPYQNGSINASQALANPDNTAAVDEFINNAIETMDNASDGLSISLGAFEEWIVDVQGAVKNAGYNFQKSRSSFLAATDYADQRKYAGEMSKELSVLRALRYLNKYNSFMNVGSAVKDIAKIINWIRELRSLFDRIDMLKLTCPQQAAVLDNLKREITPVIVDMVFYALYSVLGMAASKIAIALGFAVGPVSFVAGVVIVVAASLIMRWIENDIKNRMDNIEKRLFDIMTGPCKEPPDEPFADAGMSMTPYVDPSGYVCEAVSSNRIEGVTATLFFSNYSDGRDAVVWDAEECGQKNPLITDLNGYYEWFVPDGWWQVQYEKDGYITAYSEWLPVPPPQTEVNVMLTTYKIPKVQKVDAYRNSIEITFDSYMDVGIAEYALSVLSGSNEVSGTWTATDAEAGFDNPDNMYAKHFVFTPANTLSNTVTVVVDENAKNYAGIETDVEYRENFEIGVAPTGIAAVDSIATECGETKSFTVQIVPKEAGSGVMIEAVSLSPAVAAVNTPSVTTDTDGKAEISVTGLTPGVAAITLSVPYTAISSTVNVSVDNRYETVQKVYASIDSGTVVEVGTELELFCNTEGATIYYTTDHTCPCIEDNPARTLYTGTITITEDIYIIAYAVKDGYYESPTSKFSYTVRTPEYHTVTFADGCDGSVIDTAQVAHGADVEFPTVPEHEGYTFTSWDSDGKNIIADTTITALYEINTYTVTFKDGINDNIISTATVEHGKNATLPNAPVHEGYTFKGWDNDGKNITADITITAQYEINSYTVTFKDGLTDEVITTATVEYGKDAVMPNAPEHEGYTFTGWDNDGKNIIADITITAQYELAVVIGDLNGDGKINTADAVIVLKIAAGMIAQDENNTIAGDCNHDGKVNTADAVLILKYAAGMITEF